MKADPMRPWETAVYRAQVRTWNKAKELLGIDPRVNAMRCDIGEELREPSPIFVFRARPEYRTEAARELRRLVAKAIREERRAGA